MCTACGQHLRTNDDRKRIDFFWGLALAWLPVELPRWTVLMISVLTLLLWLQYAHMPRP